MSKSNVELVRGAMDAIARRELPELERFCLPEVEFDWSRRLLDGEVIRGYDALRRFIDDTLGIFDELFFEEEEVMDLGDDVLVVSTAVVRGRTSGAEVKARGATIWTLRDGKVARFCFYQGKEDALRDLAARKAEAAAPPTPPER